ncbi:hypothetical protein V1226_17855 [Lachnospiraceae bacterium JLR.KK009]
MAADKKVDLRIQRTKDSIRFTFRSTWPCVCPSFYGSEPPVSTRITLISLGS